MDQGGRFSFDAAMISRVWARDCRSHSAHISDACETTISGEHEVVYLHGFVHRNAIMPSYLSARRFNAPSSV